jgi:Flp pilus assembly protein TadD
MPSCRPARSRRAALLLSAALALVLGGCTARNETGVGMGRAASGSPTSVAEAARHWGERFDRNPADEQAAFAYSRALLAQDRRAQAVAVLQRAVTATRGNRFLQGELGKALAANGQLQEAIDVFAQAHAPDRPDWRILSAHGAALDQLGQPQEARRYYETALRIAPGEPSVLSNLGLSFALSGDLATAERHLRQAADHPRADPRARQNLALVVGLQGRFDEAETIARRDLPPDQAERNVALIRGMLRQSNDWRRVREPAAARGEAAAAPSPRPEADARPRGPFAAQVLAEQADRDRAPRAAAPLLAGPTAGAAAAPAPAAAARPGEPTSLLGTTRTRQERVSPERARELLGG